MTGKAVRRYQVLVRVNRFGAEHAEQFGPQTLGARTFAEVEQAVDALQRHAMAQVSARARDRVQRKALARTRLRRALRVISRTARGVAADAPSIASRFRVPKTNGDRALLTAARGFTQDAREFEAAFVAYELPATFLDDLQADVRALEHAHDDYQQSKQASVAATAGVDTVLAQAFTSVRRLDVIVANVLRGDRPALAVWREARRVATASCAR
ncbi:MAG TPA: hypothetical protein VLV86_15805 [Vicinamibacterales bacterium]|nr:hypothetical protein [Vicinamibacterales bacterium]